MIIRNYIKNPIWGIRKIKKKCMERIRGIVATIEYSSGSNLCIGKNVQLDILKITFGKNVVLNSNIHIFGEGELYIGDDVCIGDGTIVCVKKKVEICKDTMIAAQCYITDCNHGTYIGEPMIKQELRAKSVYIGSDVWIGCGCKVLMGARIGDGAVLGAGSIINNEIGDKQMVVPNRETSCYDRKKLL